MDAFTGAFFRNWRWALFLQKHVSRRALLTLVPEKASEGIVRSWKGKGFILEDKIETLGYGKESISPRPKIGFITIFDHDDPIEEVFEAARQQHEWDFFITGTPGEKYAELISRKASNVKLKGFLWNQDYIEFLKEMDVLLVLTNVRYAMNCGAFEAVSVGNPVVLTNHQLLREYFYKGAIFVENNAESIVHGIDSVIKDYQTLRQEVLQLRREKQGEWETKIEKIKIMMQGQK